MANPMDDHLTQAKQLLELVMRDTDEERPWTVQRAQVYALISIAESLKKIAASAPEPKEPRFSKPDN